VDTFESKTFKHSFQKSIASDTISSTEIEDKSHLHGRVRNSIPARVPLPKSIFDAKSLYLYTRLSDAENHLGFRDLLRKDRGLREE